MVYNCERFDHQGKPTAATHFVIYSEVIKFLPSSASLQKNIDEEIEFWEEMSNIGSNEVWCQACSLRSSKVYKINLTESLTSILREPSKYDAFKKYMPGTTIIPQGVLIDEPKEIKKQAAWSVTTGSSKSIKQTIDNFVIDDFDTFASDLGTVQKSDEFSVRRDHETEEKVFNYTKDLLNKIFVSSSKYTEKNSNSVYESLLRITKKKINYLSCANGKPKKFVFFNEKVPTILLNVVDYGKFVTVHAALLSVMSDARLNYFRPTLLGIVNEEDGLAMIGNLKGKPVGILKKTKELTVVSATDFSESGPDKKKEKKSISFDPEVLIQKIESIDLIEKKVESLSSDGESSDILSPGNEAYSYHDEFFGYRGPLRNRMENQIQQIACLECDYDVVREASSRSISELSTSLRDELSKKNVKTSAVMKAIKDLTNAFAKREDRDMDSFEVFRHLSLLLNGGDITVSFLYKEMICIFFDHTILTIHELKTKKSFLLYDLTKSESFAMKEVKMTKLKSTKTMGYSVDEILRNKVKKVAEIEEIRKRDKDQANKNHKKIIVEEKDAHSIEKNASDGKKTVDSDIEDLKADSGPKTMKSWSEVKGKENTEESNILISGGTTDAEEMRKANESFSGQENVTMFPDEWLTPSECDTIMRERLENEPMNFNDWPWKSASADGLQCGPDAISILNNLNKNEVTIKMSEIRAVYSKINKDYSSNDETMFSIEEMIMCGNALGLSFIIITQEGSWHATKESCNSKEFDRILLKGLHYFYVGHEEVRASQEKINNDEDDNGNENKEIGDSISDNSQEDSEENNDCEDMPGDMPEAEDFFFEAMEMDGFDDYEEDAVATAEEMSELKSLTADLLTEQESIKIADEELKVKSVDDEYDPFESDDGGDDEEPEKEREFDQDDLLATLISDTAFRDQLLINNAMVFLEYCIKRKISCKKGISEFSGDLNNSVFKEEFEEAIKKEMGDYFDLDTAVNNTKYNDEFNEELFEKEKHERAMMHRANVSSVILHILPYWKRQFSSYYGFCFSGDRVTADEHDQKLLLELQVLGFKTDGSIFACLENLFKLIPWAIGEKREERNKLINKVRKITNAYVRTEIVMRKLFSHRGKEFMEIGLLHHSSALPLWIDEKIEKYYLEISKEVEDKARANKEEIKRELEKSDNDQMSISTYPVVTFPTELINEDTETSEDEFMIAMKAQEQAQRLNSEAIAAQFAKDEEDSRREEIIKEEKIRQKEMIEQEKILYRLSDTVFRRLWDGTTAADHDVVISEKEFDNRMEQYQKLFSFNLKDGLRVAFNFSKRQSIMTGYGQTWDDQETSGKDVIDLVSEMDSNWDQAVRTQCDSIEDDEEIATEILGIERLYEKTAKVIRSLIDKDNSTMIMNKDDEELPTDSETSIDEQETESEQVDGGQETEESREQESEEELDENDNDNDDERVSNDNEMEQNLTDSESSLMAKKEEEGKEAYSGLCCNNIDISHWCDEKRRRYLDYTVKSDYVPNPESSDSDYEPFRPRKLFDYEGYKSRKMIEVDRKNRRESKNGLWKRSVCMSRYFGFDHGPWFEDIELKDKQLMKKMAYYSIDLSKGEAHISSERFENALFTSLEMISKSVKNIPIMSDWDGSSIFSSDLPDEDAKKLDWADLVDDEYHRINSKIEFESVEQYLEDYINGILKSSIFLSCGLTVEFTELLKEFLKDLYEFNEADKSLNLASLHELIRCPSMSVRVIHHFIFTSITRLCSSTRLAIVKDAIEREISTFVEQDLTQSSVPKEGENITTSELFIDTNVYANALQPFFSATHPFKIIVDRMLVHELYNLPPDKRGKAFSNLFDILEVNRYRICYDEVTKRGDDHYKEKGYNVLTFDKDFGQPNWGLLNLTAYYSIVSKTNFYFYRDFISKPVWEGDKLLTDSRISKELSDLFRTKESVDEMTRLSKRLRVEDEPINKDEKLLDQLFEMTKRGEGSQNFYDKLESIDYKKNVSELEVVEKVMGNFPNFQNPFIRTDDFRLEDLSELAEKSLQEDIENYKINAKKFGFQEKADVKIFRINSVKDEHIKDDILNFPDSIFDDLPSKDDSHLLKFVNEQNQRIFNDFSSKEDRTSKLVTINYKLALNHRNKYNNSFTHHQELLERLSMKDEFELDKDCEPIGDTSEVNLLKRIFKGLIAESDKTGHLYGKPKHNKFLYNLCMLFNHLIFHSTMKTDKKTLREIQKVHNTAFSKTDANPYIVTTNNFKRIGYVTRKGPVLTNPNQNCRHRLFFVFNRDKYEELKDKIGYYPEFVYRGKSGTLVESNVITISRSYTTNLERLEYKSKLYFNTFHLRMFSSPDIYYNIFFCLFYISKNVSKMLSFFKYFNVISLSNYSKLPSLIKKYLSNYPKRNCELWLRNRISDIINSANSENGTMNLLQDTSKDVVDYLEFNNLYTTPFLNITSSNHNYSKMISDIRNNIAMKDKFVHPDIYVSLDKSDGLKHIDIDLFKFGFEKLIDRKMRRLENIDDIYHRFRTTFNDFFETNTVGVNPFTGKKEANRKIVTDMLLFYFEFNKDETRFDCFKFIEFIMNQAHSRFKPFAMVSIKPQKDVGDREIYIQDFFSKMCHYPMQIVFRYFCDLLPEELVTKSEFEKVQMMSQMKFDNYSYYVNADMKKWSPQDIRDKFGIACRLLLEKGLIDNYIYKLTMTGFNLTRDLTLLVDSRCNDENALFFKFPHLSKTRFEPNEAGIKIDSKRRKDTKGMYSILKITHGWPQGIYHFASTFVHGMTCVVEESCYRSLVGPDASVMLTYHSDDKNEAISSQENFYKHMDEMLYIVETVPLSFGLSSSDTKTSVTVNGSKLSYRLNGGKKKRVSEMVSKYNIEGSIVESYTRQASNISSGMIFRTFVDNHLALMTRVCTIHRFSNLILFPELVYSNFVRMLKIMHPKEYTDFSLINHGGIKKVSIRQISEQGIFSDNVYKLVSNPEIISRQLTFLVTSKNLILNSKSAKEYQNIITNQSFIKLKNPNQISYMKNRVDILTTLQSGLFMGQRNIDYFNMYFNKDKNLYKGFRGTGGIKSFSEFMEFGSLQSIEEKIILSGVSIREIDELVCGSKTLLDDILADLNTSYEYHEPSHRWEGVIERMNIKVRGIVRHDFDECKQLVGDPDNYYMMSPNRFNYNEMIEDIMSFCGVFNIHTKDAFSQSSDKWDFVKKYTTFYKPIYFLYKGNNVYTDYIVITKKNLRGIKMKLKYQSMQEFVIAVRSTPIHTINRLKNSFNKGYYNFCMGVRSSIITDVIRILSKTSAETVEEVLDSCHDIEVKSAVSFFLRKDMEIAFSGTIPINQRPEEDLSIYALVERGSTITRYIIYQDQIMTEIPDDVLAPRHKSRILSRHKRFRLVKDEELRKYFTTIFADDHLPNGSVLDLYFEKTEEEVSLCIKCVSFGKVVIFKKKPRIFTLTGSVPTYEMLSLKNILPTVTIQSGRVEIKEFQTKSYERFMQTGFVDEFIFKSIERLEESICLSEDNELRSILKRKLNLSNVNSKKTMINLLNKRQLKVISHTIHPADPDLSARIMQEGDEISKMSPEAATYFIYSNCCYQNGIQPGSVDDYLNFLENRYSYANSEKIIQVRKLEEKQKPNPAIRVDQIASDVRVSVYDTKTGILLASYFKPVSRNSYYWIYQVNEVFEELMSKSGLNLPDIKTEDVFMTNCLGSILLRTWRRHSAFPKDDFESFKKSLDDTVEEYMQRLGFSFHQVYTSLASGIADYCQQKMLNLDGIEHKIDFKTRKKISVMTVKIQPPRVGDLPPQSYRFARCLFNNAEEMKKNPTLCFIRSPLLIKKAHLAYDRALKYVLIQVYEPYSQAYERPCYYKPYKLRKNIDISKPDIVEDEEDIMMTELEKDQTLDNFIRMHLTEEMIESGEHTRLMKAANEIRDSDYMVKDEELNYYFTSTSRGRDFSAISKEVHMISERTSNPVNETLKADVDKAIRMYLSLVSPKAMSLYDNDQFLQGNIAIVPEIAKGKDLLPTGFKNDFLVFTDYPATITLNTAISKPLLRFCMMMYEQIRESVRIGNNMAILTTLRIAISIMLGKLQDYEKALAMDLSLFFDQIGSGDEDMMSRYAKDIRHIANQINYKFLSD
jgi:hypothetical protein